VALPYIHQSNGRVVVNAAVESWLPLPRMSLYAVSIHKSKCTKFVFSDAKQVKFLFFSLKKENSFEP
jgi:hypothetical protein